MTTTKTKTAPAPSLAPPTLDELKAEINEAMAAEIAANWTQEKIQARVRTMINSNFEQIVRVSLGFAKSSWGNGWEVDHCNGRSGESVIGQMIAEAARRSVDEAIAKGVTEGKFKINDATIKVMEKEFTDQVRGYTMRKRVEQHASEQMDRLFDLLNGKFSGASV